MNSPFKIIPEHGRAIVGNFHPADGFHPKPLIIFCHGYKGFKDWGAWHLMATAFTDAGFDFVRFNFSHNGSTAEQHIDFPDLEAFSNNNYSLEMQDLQTVIDHFCSEANENFEKRPSKLYLLGHSRGGGIVSLTAGQDKRIDKVATLASVSDYRARFLEGTEHFQQWKEKGITYVENSRTGQMLPHKFQFYTDFITNEAKLTIRDWVKQIEIPHLIIHGTADPTVDLKEGRAIHSWNPASELSVIEDADHVFGMQHPWNSDTLPPAMKLAVDKLIEFYSAD